MDRLSVRSRFAAPRSSSSGFIPGGRAVTTFACGTVGFPYHHFLVADAAAALSWATYTALLGFIGGNSSVMRFGSLC
jgi:membrane-associated protein